MSAGEPGVRVLVYHRAPEGEEFEEAYRRAADLLAGTEGLLRHELLHSPGHHELYLLVMDWADRDAFTGWEQALRHAHHPSPLRRYQDRSRPGGHYEIHLLVSPDGNTT
ncbi:antibiotic biosynthesis monooxygenase family protein [Nonomuraea glycinis]|uniref:antibiotic biosynthesis monooxygenase family protein n=1 Tax=Nonomuraea glycinis TaxID=2047744 RepID=UPI0033A59F16